MLPTQLRTFYAVAREGSFTAAARVLHVSQPTLTSQIKKLEASYGIDLFRRHGRGVELTETGKQLLKIAKLALFSVLHFCDIIVKILKLILLMECMM